MESTLSIVEILDRVERELDALYALNTTAKDFAIGCVTLEEFLEVHRDSFSLIEPLDGMTRDRVLTVIARLEKLQKRAALKALIPEKLQKYIAENQDRLA